MGIQGCWYNFSISQIFLQSRKVIYYLKKRKKERTGQSSMPSALLICDLEPSPAELGRLL